MGGGAVTQHLAQKFKRVYASDAHEDLMLMWQAVQDGWVPPSNVSLEEYQALRDAEPSALRGFVGFGGSFGGKWFGGYARGGFNADGTPRNHQDESARSLVKSAGKLHNVTFMQCSYEQFSVPTGSVIYCDPPYADTTGYEMGFDSAKFWQWAERQARAGVLVYVSEYKAPDGWGCVWEAAIRQSSARPEQGRDIRIERLFTYAGIGNEVGKF